MRAPEVLSRVSRDGQSGCGPVGPDPTQCLGRALVARLLDFDPGKTYLVCEDRLIEFFQSFGFSLFPAEDMPDGLRPKWQCYSSKVGLMNVMVRS